MQRLASCSLAAGLVLALASPVWGHALLQSPVPRSDADDNKAGPCGPAAVTVPGAGNTFAPGSTINILWAETIEHPGNYRVAFSPDGTNVFDANILEDLIPDRQDGATRQNPVQYMQQVTLPDMECENCVLQLIQVMTENPASPSLYYSCADIKLQAGATNPDTGNGDGNGNGTGNGDGSGDMGAEDPYGPDPGFCDVSAGGRREAPLAALALVLAALAAPLALRLRTARR